MDSSAEELKEFLYFLLAADLAAGLCVLCVAICVRCCRSQPRDEEYPILRAQPEAQFTQEYQQLPGDLLTVHTDLANECAVCLESFNIGEMARVLSCGHYYHQECVDPWLRQGKPCPKCRGEPATPSELRNDLAPVAV